MFFFAFSMSELPLYFLQAVSFYCFVFKNKNKVK